MENRQTSWGGVMLVSVQIWLFILKLLGVSMPWVVVLLPLLLVCGAVVLSVIMLCVAMTHDTDGDKKEDSKHEHTA